MFVNKFFEIYCHIKRQMLLLRGARPLRFFMQPGKVTEKVTSWFKVDRKLLKSHKIKKNSEKTKGFHCSLR